MLTSKISVSEGSFEPVFSEMRTGCWEPDERGERGEQGEQGEHAKNATFTTYPQESKGPVNKVNVARGILISRARRMPN
jgi:hypothetical protein